MNPSILLSTVTLSLQVAALIVAFAIGRAPGWRRVRIVGVLAASAGAYSLSSLLGWVFGHSPEVVWTVANANFVVVGVHVAGWLWFSYADADGSWRKLPRWVRRTALGLIALTTILGATGLAHDLSSFSVVRVESLGYEFGRATLSTAGSVAAALVLAIVLVSLAKQVEEARKGTRGSRAIVAGFVVLLLAGIEETLVAAGALDFMFLAEVGYLALVGPVIAQLVRRFVDDARRLEVLTEWLAAEVETTTHERDDARHALEAQQRFASLGRIAGGIGHEINNPLQILALNLSEMQETHLAGAGPDAREAVSAAMQAADRIGRVVAAVRAYAQPLAVAPSAIALRDVVDEGVRIARTQVRGETTIRVDHDGSPSVRGDPERLAQLVAASIANAAKVLAGRARFGEIRVRTLVSATKEAVIEVSDNGPGFPSQVLEHLDEYLTRGREAAGTSGLGLFVARAVVEAHGGTLELGRSDLGGALFRVRLPLSGQHAAA